MVFLRKTCYSHIQIAVTLLLLFWFSTDIWAQTSPPKADLYYFVIDRSASISENGLEEPINKALSDFVSTIPVESEVSVVFFNQGATNPKRWVNLGLKEKSEIYQFFQEQFRPAGRTRLYDTMAEVIDRVRATVDGYEVINIIVLSDGEDNESKKHRSWSALEPIAGKLMRDHKNTFIAWYTLGFSPKDIPTKNGPIEHIPVPEPRKEFRIKEPKPSGEFEAVPTKVKINQPVLFTLVSQIGVREVVWDFGDGTTSTGMLEKHIYDREGVFDASVTVSGPGGESTVVHEKLIQVKADVALSANFAWEPLSVRTNQKLRLIDESVGAASAWSWSVPEIGQINERNPIIEFTTSGEKKITLIVKNEDSESILVKTIEILEPLPDASFDVESLELTLGEVVNFKANVTETDWSHSWTIGGSIILEGVSTKWESDRSGRIGVLHRVEGSGGVSVAEQILYVKEPEKILIPVATFKVSNTEGRMPLKVQFQNESKGDIVAYQWDFGDGESSDQRDPEHVYTGAGEYQPRLVIQNSEGQEGKDSGAISIIVKSPLPNWLRYVIYVASALVGWVFIIVPFLLKPLMAPKKGAALKGANIRYLKRLAGKHLGNYIWPRSYITIGSNSNDDIKVGSVGKKGKTAARFSRTFASDTYTLKVLTSNAVDEIRQTSSFGDQADEINSLSKGRTKPLRDGDRVRIFGTEFAWVQSKPKKSKQIKKK